MTTPPRLRLAVAASAAVAAGLLIVPPADAVSGGTPAPDKAFDFVVRVAADGHGCSGVLLGPQWIVTASGCVPAGSGTPASPVTVTAGAATAKVATLIPRPDRDLVLAKLATPIANVTPISLGRTAPAAGETLTVAGFGRTSDTWVPDKATTSPFTTSSVAATAFGLTNADGHDTCLGDAGGPAIRTTANNTPELVGISSRSWQHGCLAVTETRQGSVETRTDDLVDWIRAQAPELAIQCRTTVPLFAVTSDLQLYPHPNPADGGPMDPRQSTIGTGGWNGYVRLLAGPDGLLYGIRANGDVYRYQWNGTGWTPDSRTVVAAGWTGFDNTANHNRITIDSRGDIYVVNADGSLSRRRYDTAAKTWSSETLGTGWNSYNLITGGGDGVLYARSTDGFLYRYAWDEAGHKWAQEKKLVGNGGWNAFTRITSAGADVLYTVTGKGELRWYRYLPYSDTWSPGPTVIGDGGWQQFSDVEAQRNSCTLVR